MTVCSTCYSDANNAIRVSGTLNGTYICALVQSDNPLTPCRYEGEFDAAEISVWYNQGGGCAGPADEVSTRWKARLEITSGTPCTWALTIWPAPVPGFTEIGIVGGVADQVFTDSISQVGDCRSPQTFTNDLTNGCAWDGPGGQRQSAYGGTATVVAC